MLFIKPIACSSTSGLSGEEGEKSPHKDSYKEAGLELIQLGKENGRT